MRSKAEKFSIGVLIGNVHSPHTVDLMLGMEEAAAQLDANIFYFLGTHSSHLLEYLFGRGTKANYDYQFNTIYDYAHLAKLDALIISYGSLCIFLENTSKEEFLERFRNIPYILIEDIEDREDTNNLLTDNIGGMTLLVEHLLRDHGYTKVTYISGPIGNRDGDQRRDTVKQLCAQYHVPLPEDAIEYGNYSQHVYEQAHKLLDRYPDTEVIICANDEMALGACQVCEARGLIVGKDIAVTGFDNNMNAQLAKIPLTTVKQSGFDMGYQSIQSAMKLCHGERVGRTLIPTKFIPRESCGCKNVTLSSTPFIQEDGDIHDASYIARQITKSIIESRQNPQMFEKIYQTTKRMVEGGLLLADPKASTSSHDAMNQILDALTELTGDEMLPYISRSTLDNLNIDWLEHLSTCVTDTQTHNNMLRVLSKIQSKRWALTLYDSSRELEELTCKSWALQIVAREMTERVDSTEAFYESALGNLKMFGVHSSYIYLLDEVMIHRPHMTRKQPERLHLAAWHCEDEVVSYKRDERPVIDASNGFAPFLKKAGKQYFGFILFSDERQYGLMFCEIESKDVAILYFISLQIGSALRFYELHNK
ncbi:MAG: substrate-binding domain-containing protein [Clostridium sp.]|jgi:DNA-binding LacI/PurR family transcriptional regulator|nr:substrate-binding domain-containing protein [Clostridium sp.]